MLHDLIAAKPWLLCCYDAPIRDMPIEGNVTLKQREHSPEADQIKRSLRRDLIALFAAVLVAVFLISVFDTGSLAEWVARHKDTKIDETIVVTFVFAIGLSIFSIRRWLDLSRQLIRYEELHERLTKLSNESALLGELSDLLQSCLSTEEAHKLITDRAQILFPGSSGAVCVTANSRDLVEVLATWGEPSLVERFFAPKDCWALRRGRIHVLGEDSTVLACAHLGEIRPQCAMCVPMMAHGEAIGLLYLDRRSGQTAQPSHWSEPEQRLARTLAEHAALALANLKLREILRSQSVRDPLTGLYNRRYMEESLELELRRAVRKKCSLGVMMLDVDHFKRFNDRFGHEAGDSVLQALANLFRTQLRGGDVACRYGGEEFTMILPEASLEATRLRAEQLREAAKAAISQFRGGSLDQVTLSVGVASFPDKGTTVEALLRAADAALYRAKEQGRDRVVVA